MDIIEKNKAEILRYLGYRNQEIDSVTNMIIEEAIDEINYLKKEKYIYRFFCISKGKGKLLLDNSSLKLIGNDIKKHLNKSESCVLMAATLGHDVDTKIRYYEKTSMTKALILDACATAAIEEICDRLCEDIGDIIAQDNKKLTSRYSPGYGDFPLNIQSDFLEVLGAKKSIGLTASSESILIPRKSVTAIAGIIDIESKAEEISCLNCNKYAACNFSKGDARCGT